MDNDKVFVICYRNYAALGKKMYAQKRMISTEWTRRRPINYNLRIKDLV